MIGETLLSWNLMNPNNPAGKFLKSLHRIEDALWNLGSKKIPKKIAAPELEKQVKIDPKAEKEQADKLNAEREEAKKLIDPELIKLAKRINLDAEFDMDKLNSVFDFAGVNENKEKPKKEINEGDMITKANIAPVLDFLLKEKIEIENLKKQSDYNDINNEEAEENEENEEAEKNEKDNEDGNDAYNNEENEENSENNSLISEENTYFKEENLEFALEKIKKFNAYYDYLETEFSKYLDSKNSENQIVLKEEEKEANNKGNKDSKENKLLGAESEKDEANKKVKQHKKKNKNKEKNDNLIDISAITDNSESKDNLQKKEEDEFELKKLKNEFLKTTLNLDLEYETLKAFRNQMFKITEFLIFALISAKAKSNANFLADPKFLDLLNSYKIILEEAEKIKASEKANKEQLSDLTNLNGNNFEKEENEDLENMLSKITPEEMDENINLIFFSVLKLAVLPKKDEIFPLDPGKLLREYLKPMANELDMLFDFRFSSFKKINNYLKSLAKNDDLIVFSKPKGMQNEFILSVNWQADKIKNFVPPVKKAMFLTNKVSNKDDDRENVILNKDEKIELMQMFKPNGVIADIFKKYEKGHERYF